MYETGNKQLETKQSNNKETKEETKEINM